jgi:hypothetical protein
MWLLLLLYCWQHSSVLTNWRAASPNEVEAEIIEPQEDVLRGLPGMTRLLAKAQEGRGEITITFSVDMDLRRALVEVINRLNQVPSYPGDVDEPTISTVGGNARAIAWFIIKPLAGNDRDISSYKNYVEEVVQSGLHLTHTKLPVSVFKFLLHLKSWAVAQTSLVVLLILANANTVLDTQVNIVWKI